jgi:cellulose synthase/poly-beta-1,6-N-acetylglucosamine synthase-like glycosyltransferase
VQHVPIPGSEIICIFDADQVAKPEFFLRTLPLFDSGDDVGMVLSPQCFHNLDYHTDIFNHSNLQFWEYMQPGYDAWGFISCTGALNTNSSHRRIPFLSRPMSLLCAEANMHSIMHYAVRSPHKSMPPAKRAVCARSLRKA